MQLLLKEYATVHRKSADVPHLIAYPKLRYLLFDSQHNQCAMNAI